MRSIILKAAFAAALLTSALFAAPSQAGTVVVNSDEWSLSDSGFAQSADTSRFVANLVAEFGPNIHAYSTNFGFTGAALANAMNAAGASYSTGLGITFDLATLSAFDAIFLGGAYLNAAQIDILTQYVGAGGGVYIAAGTGAGGAVEEANAWNGFLAQFGLSLALSYNGVSGNIALPGDPLTNGVATLFMNNGNTISGDGAFCCDGRGLLAVVRMDTNEIPLPAAAWLMIAGLSGLGFAARRKA